MQLSETWFIEGYIDFELQKYRLLAYLNEVNQYFNESKLYPKLSDTLFHYNNLIAFRDNKKFLQDKFPRQLTQVNLQKVELVYEQMLQDNEIMQELEHITNFALEKFKTTIESGAELYDLVEKQIHIEPVGIMPLYKNEGYVLLRFGPHTEIRAYNYIVTLFEHQHARYKGLKMQYVDSWTGTITHTYESIKRDIIRSIRTLPNPAVYSVETPLTLPLDETLLPIAKRCLVRYIETDKAA